MSLQAAIKKRFSGFSLDVSLNTDGGVMGILGASGSGKSMTLKCHRQCGWSCYLRYLPKR